MKSFLTLLALLFISSGIKADCASSGLLVIPASSSVCQNPVFMIEGYGTSETIINNLNIKHPVYLQSGTNKIKLLVLEICVGDLYLTQAILKPEKELDAGLIYTLHIDSLPVRESLREYNSSTRNYTAYTYRTLAKKDIQKPVLKSSPKEIGKQYLMYGCGPSINVIYSLDINDETTVFVKTSVRNIETGKTTTYYLLTSGGQIRVGQDMCSGAFSLTEGNLFEVTFSFMDASGNILPWNGKTYQFSRPTPENSKGTF